MDNRHCLGDAVGKWKNMETMYFLVQINSQFGNKNGLECSSKTINNNGFLKLYKTRCYSSDLSFVFMKTVAFSGVITLHGQELCEWSHAFLPFLEQSYRPLSKFNTEKLIFFVCLLSAICISQLNTFDVTVIHILVPLHSTGPLRFISVYLFPNISFILSDEDQRLGRKFVKSFQTDQICTYPKDFELHNRNSLEVCCNWVEDANLVWTGKPRITARTFVNFSSFCVCT